jgi:hypothetical protein
MGQMVGLKRPILDVHISVELKIDAPVTFQPDAKLGRTG